MHLLILSDDKKGHENQSVGLAEALLRRREGSYEVSSISNGVGSSEVRADVVIAAGHSTHPFLLKEARRHRCPSVVIMKPSLPAFLFSHCIIPEHDLRNPNRVRRNVIATKGALNRIPETIPPKQEKGLVMVGGPSKHFDWQPAPVLAAIEAIVTANPHLQWTVGDSRRTPEDFLTNLRNKRLPLTFAPHQDTAKTWLVDEMLTSEIAWITPDSTSMLFEALTAGCRLGTLPLPPHQTRLARAHSLLASEGWLTPFEGHSPVAPLPEPSGTLHETGRCAELLLNFLLS